MIKIERDALYTRSDLAALLEPAGINVDNFIAKIEPPKFHRKVWLGSHLLEAMENAEPMRAAPATPSRPCGFKVNPSRSTKTLADRYRAK